ncbi:MAG: sialate O-acetylesterase [Gemmataceae bacterium]
MLRCFLSALLVLLAGGVSHAKTVKVFILAGQSNMEGQAVADLAGKDYNEGRGTLKAVLADPQRAALAKHLVAADGKWVVRNDVRVRYQREKQPLLSGPLSIGFAVYGGTHHFGPELQFGHVVGDHFTEPVLLVKTAWGGKSLHKDFRPPSSGGETGPYYTKMLAEVREALANIKTDFPDADGGELAGFVWYQGWNDGVDPKNAVPEYEQNLVNLIRDVRTDLKSPNLPVVIGELTGPWVEAPGAWATLRKAQAAAADRPEFIGNVLFVPTHDFVRPAKESPNPGHGHHEFGNAETYLLVGDALGKGMVKLVGGADPLAGKRIVFLGDSNTQAGGYVAFTTYYLEKLNPKKNYDIISVGLASETASGLSEENHAGGKFPRPSVFERLDRVLEKTKPEVVFACYGMNDGIYLPLDADRTAAFRTGITKLVEKCQAAGAKQVYLITPPIYDFAPKPGEFNYDTVLAEFAKWEMSMKLPGVTVIDLHTAMRKARDARTEAYSKDKVHPGDDGHLFMAKTLLAAFDIRIPDDSAATIKADPLFKLVEQKRALRSAAWMKHIGYTREVTVKPQPLGTAEEDAAKLQEKIDALRRAK